MFDLEQAITEWRRQMAAGGIKAADVLDELESHLREDIRRLIGSGLPDDEAFNVAVRQLGDGAELRNEFANASAAEVPSARAQAIAVNVLGWWFILTGLNYLSGLLRIVLMTGTLPNHWGIVLFCFFGPALFLTGIGLLRRRNLWRLVGWGWCILGCTLILAAILFPGPHFRSGFIYAPPTAGVLVRFVFLGLSVPYGAYYAMGILQMALLVFGAYFLAQRNTRSLFFQGGT